MSMMCDYWVRFRADWLMHMTSYILHTNSARQRHIFYKLSIKHILKKRKLKRENLSNLSKFTQSVSKGIRANTQVFLSPNFVVKLSGV